MLRALNRVLDHLEEWLIATLIAAATGLIFIAVLHRYGTGLSIDLSKWAAAHGVPVVPQIAKGIYSWLASLDGKGVALAPASAVANRQPPAQPAQ